MSDTSDPQEPVQPTAPVPASGHLGAEPVVPEVAAPPAEPAASAEPPAEPVAAAEPVAETAVLAPAASREVVYVQAPTPPPARHNRGFGVLISLLGAVAFALLYVAAAALVFVMTPHTMVEPTFNAFLASDAFWIPVAVYAVVSTLFALIVDRASWWAHVLGSIVVAALSYGISVGVLALVRNVVAMTPDDGMRLLADLATHALLLCVLALARECALWFGLAISARGRRVRESNIAARAAFEQSVADRRAEYERAHPAV